MAPGTVGTLAAWGAVSYGSGLPAWVWIPIGLGAFALGIPAVHRVHRRTGVVDPGWVVLDEAAAYWLAYGLLGGGAFELQAAVFFVFRLFDVWKPWPIRPLERRWHNGFGVMADDLVAALYTSGVVWLALQWRGVGT